MNKEKTAGRLTRLKISAERPTYFIFVWLLSVVLLFFLCFVLNYQYVPKAFVNDGLSSILHYRQTSFWDYINPLQAGGHLRPVVNLVFSVVFGIAGTNVALVGQMLLVFNFFLALAVYYMATKISGRFLIGFCAAVCFLMSHLAYYQISETFGFMEGFALLFSLCLLYQLYRYINDEAKPQTYYAAIVFYLLASLTHERFFVLFPLFPIAIVLRNIQNKGTWKTKQQWIKLVCSILVFSMLLLLRFMLLGRGAMSGTEGSNIIDTFYIARAVKIALIQVLFLFGFTRGPSYLMGTSMEYFTSLAWTLIVIYIACIVVVFVWVFILFLRYPNIRKALGTNFALFACFIGGCIVSSSTTVRLEMRWIYVSQMAFVLLVCYLMKVIIENTNFKNIKLKPLLLTLPLVFSISFGSMEAYYRQSWPNIYIMEWVETSNALYDVLVEPYGEGLNHREIIFVSERSTAPVLQQWEFELTSYFEQFDLHPQITCISSFYDLKEEDIDGIKIIVQMQTDYHPLQIVDLTDVPIKTDPQTGEIWDIQGIDGDGWTGTYFSFKTLTSASGTITLDCIASRAEPGDTVTISVNGVKTVFEVDSIYITFTVQTKPNTTVEVEVESSFAIVTPPDVRYQSLLIQEIIVD